MKANSALSFFYEGMLDDASIGTTHIALFMALYQLWSRQQWSSPLLIKRREAMVLAKIGSSATYHKCLQQLISSGFIYYYPCSNPASKSKIYFGVVRMSPKPQCGAEVAPRRDKPTLNQGNKPVEEATPAEKLRRKNPVTAAALRLRGSSPGGEPLFAIEGEG